MRSRCSGIGYNVDYDQSPNENPNSGSVPEEESSWIGGDDEVTDQGVTISYDGTGAGPRVATLPDGTRIGYRDNPRPEYNIDWETS